MKTTTRFNPSLILTVLIACCFAGCGGSGETPLVRLDPATGDIMKAIQAEMPKAKAAGKRPFLYLTSNQCPSCTAIEDNMDDELMKEAFAGTYIMELNLDTWQSALSSSTFRLGAAPAYYELKGDSIPELGRSINAGAWVDNTPEVMAPILKEFFKR